MATSEKGGPVPPSYVPGYTAPYAPGTAPGYEGQQPQPVGYPPPGGYYYPPPSGVAATSQPPPPAYQQQQTTGVVVVGAPPVVQNVMVVRTVRANVQIPDVYPGLAFCMFAPGIIETMIRSSIVVRQFNYTRCFSFARVKSCIYIVYVSRVGDVIGLDCCGSGHH